MYKKKHLKTDFKSMVSLWALVVIFLLSFLTGLHYETISLI